MCVLDRTPLTCAALRPFADHCTPRIPDTILSKPGKVIVLVVTVALAVVCGWGAPQVEAMYESSWFLPSDSTLVDVNALTDAHFPGKSSGVVIYGGPGDYSTDAAQDLMRSYLGAMVELDDISSCQGWYSALRLLYGAEGGTGNIPTATFYANLDSFLLSHPMYVASFSPAIIAVGYFLCYVLVGAW